VKDPDKLLGALLGAARDGSTAVDSSPRCTFIPICAALCNSELYQSVYGQLGDRGSLESVVDCLSTPGCTIATELEFISSHFYDFRHQPDTWIRSPFSMIYDIVSRGSLRLRATAGSMIS
jgi:hypothetical protein